MPRKRKSEEVDDDDVSTPRKANKYAHDNAYPTSSATSAATPSNRKSILKNTPSHANGHESVQETPTSLRRVLFSTPGHVGGSAGDEDETPTNRRNERSALKKSRQALLAQTDDDEWADDGQEDGIAQVILGEEDIEEDGEDIPDSAPDTPSKPRRGRPKGRRRERTPSPPPDLPPHERYFFENRAGANKTSSNTLPSHLLLGADEYHAQIRAYQDPHTRDFERLQQLHARSFDQWIFELEEGFNICLYGYGSKRSLLMQFAEHINRSHTSGAPKIVVVNGYTPGLTIRDILTTIARTLLPKTLKLPAQAPALLDVVTMALGDPSPKIPLTMIVHSLDHANLRRPTTQSILARLAAHPSVTLVASCDTLNFPLLWDVPLSRQFQFLFHDATTFHAYQAEIDVVEDVNGLLGRSRRSLNGKDGVGYVLQSLPENARSLFRILVAEQLALADVEGDAAIGAFRDDSDPEDILGAQDEDEAAAQQQTPSRRGRGRPPKAKPAVKVPKPTLSGPVGVEYRTLYHKAVEEFVCSSEVNFRTLLKEFHDHQMIESRKDALGTERLIVPFRREELETILEELV